MPESTLQFFNSGLRELFAGGVNLSKTFQCALLSSAYTLNLDETSWSNSFSGYVCRNASGGPAIKQVGQGEVTRSPVGTVIWDLPDVAFTASTGSVLCAKYAILVQSGVDTPVAVFSLSAVESTAKIVQIQWP